jgi:succinyl-diaminopimelate desuccinylase
MYPVALAQELIRFPSVNPLGEEKACVEHLARLMEGSGFSVEVHEFAPGRPSSSPIALDKYTALKTTGINL